jgi:hypothetical protein
VEAAVECSLAMVPSSLRRPRDAELALYHNDHAASCLKKEAAAILGTVTTIIVAASSASPSRCHPLR